MIRVIPAIDIIDGKVVRLKQGNFDARKNYDETPVEIAKRYEDLGLSYLHLVDLDGARVGRLVNHNILEEIASKTSLNIDFGGGLRTESDIKKAFDCGACQVTVGSVAVRHPKKVRDWITKYSSEKIILGADIKNEHITIAGWQENTSFTIFEFIMNYLPYGIKTVICTDVERDGILQGPSTEIYRKIKNKFPELYLVASGGVKNIKDVINLDEHGINAVIIGKALLENKIKPVELIDFLC